MNRELNRASFFSQNSWPGPAQAEKGGGPRTARTTVGTGPVGEHIFSIPYF